MELINHNRIQDLTIDLQTVEAMTPAALRQKITTPRFRWQLPPQEAINILAAHYVAAVRERGRNVVWTEETVRTLREVTHFLTDPKNDHHGLALVGGVGCGKTTMMEAIISATAYLDRGRGHFAFMDDPVTGTPHHPNFVQYSARSLVDKVKSREGFEYIKSVRYLAIDDLGTDAASVVDYGTIRNPIAEIFEYRYGRNLCTMITTNIAPNEMADIYGLRVADRMREMLQIVSYADGSFRN